MNVCDVDAHVGQAKGAVRDRSVRRTELVEAAITVIRREGRNASMDQMAAEAGVSKPILYRHFTDRSGLIGAIADHVFATASHRLARALRTGATYRERVGNGVDEFLTFIEADPEIYRLLSAHCSDAVNGSGPLNDYSRLAGRRIALVLADALGSVGADLAPTEAWAFGIVGMIQTAADWWMGGGDLTRQELCTHLTTLIVDGLPLADSAIPTRSEHTGHPVRAATHHGGNETVPDESAPDALLA